MKVPTFDELFGMVKAKRERGEKPNAMAISDKCHQDFKDIVMEHMMAAKEEGIRFNEAMSAVMTAASLLMGDLTHSSIDHSKPGAEEARNRAIEIMANSAKMWVAARLAEDKATEEVD